MRQFAKHTWAALLSTVLCLVLAGCGAGGQELPAEPAAPAAQPPAASAPAPAADSGTADSGTFSFEGTVFTYDGENYDMMERCPSATAVMECTPVGDQIVVECHVGPKNGWYSVYDTQSRAFVRDFAGCNLIWKDDDITTAVYNFWADILNYNGDVIATAALNEGDFIYELAFQDGGTRLAVTICSDYGEDSTVLLDIK